MRIYYYRDALGNFGDDLNPWLWPRLLPTRFDDDGSELFIGIGTLLSDQVPVEPRKVVMGAGVGYGEPPRLDARWNIHFVRGPVTAQALGLADRQWITDPAALLYRLPHRHDPSRPPGFIPHHRSEGFMNWRAVCDLVGLRYIDPRGAPKRVMQEIQHCGLLLAEAMHGAIVADAFRIPWIPVGIYPQFNHLKWNDWLKSLALSEDIVDLPGQYDGTQTRFGARLRNGIRWIVRHRSPLVPRHVALGEHLRESPEAQERMAEALGRALSEEPRLSDTLTLERAVHRMEEALFRFGGTLHELA